MNKTEIQESIKLLKEEHKMLTDWIVEHHTHPYISEIAQRARVIKCDEERLTILDQEIYPTLEEVKAVSYKQLLIWYRHIPQPRNEKEKEVRMLMGKRISEYNTPFNTKNQ
jgi:hypothetical protein